MEEQMERRHHREERHDMRVRTQPVVLDIGEDTGGLVIYTGPELRGREIEISLCGAGTSRVHTDVAERRVNGRTLYAAVYLPMPAGNYTIWGPDPDVPTTVTIAAGIVAEVDWR
jgi:hypothetical protein